MTCITFTGFYYSLTGIPLFFIPDFKKSCFVIDSLLKSDLQCFYNQTCIDCVKSFYTMSSALNMILLNLSSFIHFSTNSSIPGVTDELIVDQWTITIIGLVGGLISALKVIVSCVVKFMTKYIVKKKKKINATTA